MNDTEGLLISRCSLEAEVSSGTGWSDNAGPTPPPLLAAGAENDDRELVDQAKAGDLTAQALLFDAHYVRVYRYVWSKVDRKEDAEDLAQEAFIRMLDALPRFQHRGAPFRSWLMQIAANLVKDYYRHKGTRGRTSSLDDKLEISGGNDPALAAELAQSMAEVTEAMQEHLTDLEREVIRLRYVAELSIAETAAVLGKNENNVKQLTFKALGKLRKVLKQENAKAG